MPWLCPAVERVRVAVAVMPLALAVIVVVPGPTPVARPDASIVATAGLLELHVTRCVQSVVAGGGELSLTRTSVPSALNCIVWSAADKLAVEGATLRKSSL